MMSSFGNLSLGLMSTPGSLLGPLHFHLHTPLIARLGRSNLGYLPCPEAERRDGTVRTVHTVVGTGILMSYRFVSHGTSVVSKTVQGVFSIAETFCLSPKWCFRYLNATGKLKTFPFLRKADNRLLLSLVSIASSSKGCRLGVISLCLGVALIIPRSIARLVLRLPFLINGDLICEAQGTDQLLLQSLTSLGQGDGPQNELISPAEFGGAQSDQSYAYLGFSWDG